MKVILSVFLVLLGASCCRATTPFSPAIFENDNFTFIVGFPWPDQNEKVLLIRTMERTSLFSLDELGLTPFEEVTTAGYGWYQNSIGYVTSLKTRNKHSESHHRVFYFRHRNGKEIVIDLKTKEIINPASVLDKQSLDKKTISEAAFSMGPVVVKSPTNRSRFFPIYVDN